VYLAVLAFSLIIGPLVIVGCGDYYSAREGDAPTTETTATLETTTTATTDTAEVRGTVVSQIKNALDLEPGLMVVAHRLGVNFEVPGVLYGAKAKQPLQLGPQGGKKGQGKDSLSGGDLPVAVLLPDGRQLLYQFWEVLVSDDPGRGPGDPVIEVGTHMATPSIRVRDLISGEDRLVVSGAHSTAWRADGTLAYAQGVDVDYRYNMPYLSRVVVRKGLDGPTETWTSDADRYTVLRWAKDSLLVWREFMDGGGQLLALDGPDEIRVIIPVGEEGFVALSPDGERILTSSGGPESGEPPMIREVEWRTGREIARLSFQGVLDPLSGGPIQWVTGASWEKDRVVVATSADLAIISAKDDALVLEEVVAFDYPGLGPASVFAPLLDETGSRVSFVVDEVTDTYELVRCAVVTYDLSSGECRRWISPGGPTIAGLVYNPSRPR